MRTVSFDLQASTFDQRAGLPPGVPTDIAAAILALVPAQEEAARVVEIGAGTGELGVEIARGAVRYVGIDLSTEMLAVFRRRAELERVPVELVAADANARWPVPDASASLVFGSRSLHWLSAEHIAGEVLRVAAPSGCVLLVGRVTRDPDGAREVVRRKMRDLLREQGLAGRSGRRHAAELVEACLCRGATAVPSRVVAEWTRRESPSAMIDAWGAKSGLSGLALEDAQKRALLERLVAWTAGAFGNIDALLESRERYTLEGAVIRPAPSDARPR